MTAPTASPWAPLPWQVAPWRDKSPVVLLTGSAGGGKSRLAAEKVHGFCLKYPGATGLMMRKTRQSMTNSTVLFFDRVVAGGACRHYPSKYRFEYENGSLLAYGGMADEEQKEQIRSIGQDGGVDICWMEEANRNTEDDYNEILGRMRGKAAPWRQVLLTTNPDAPTHWIKRRLIDNNEASVYYSQAADNTHNPDDYAANLAKISGMAYRRLVLGEWVQAEGAVYSTWDSSVMVVNDDRLREWGIIEGYAAPMPVLNRQKVRKVVVGVDWGFTNPGVLLVVAIDEAGRKYVVYQVVQTGKLIDWWVQQAKAIKAHFRPFIFACDPAEPAYILQFRQNGIPCVEADNDIEAGIQSVQREMVVDVAGRPRFCVRAGSCVEPDPVLVKAKKPATLEDEIVGYQWQESPDGKPVKELPIKVNDHACLVGETLVQTPAGSCRLMDVKPGDLVLGRCGFVRVLVAGMTQADAALTVVRFGNGAVLTGTGNHPVYTNTDGFVRMDALRYGVQAWYNDCQEDTLCRTENQRASSIAVSSSADTQTPSNGVIATTTRQALQRVRPALTTSTGRFTRIGLARFQPAMTCTTKTTTRSTTTRTTWSASSIANTCDCTRQRSAKNDAPPCGRIFSSVPFQRQESGMAQGKGESGTGSTQSGLSLASLNPSNGLATSAARSLKRRSVIAASVPTSANQRSGGRVALTTRSGSASSAGVNLASITTASPRAVLVPVLAVCDGQRSAPVYNLTVEGGEYYANGILVHNCDGLRYAIHYVATGGAVTLPPARQRSVIG